MFILLFSLSTFLVNAQYTFYAYESNLVDKETGKVSSSETGRELYNISFTDNILIHNVFSSSGDYISDSQVYKIIDKVELKNGGIEFTTISGVTGNTYTYRLETNGSSTSSLTQIFKNEDYNKRYKGDLATLKTYRQE